MEHKEFVRDIVAGIAGSFALLLAIIAPSYTLSFEGERRATEDRNDFYLALSGASVLNKGAHDTIQTLRTLGIHEAQVEEISALQRMLERRDFYGRLVSDEWDLVVNIAQKRIPVESALRPVPSWSGYWREVLWWLLWIVYPLFSAAVVFFTALEHILGNRIPREQVWPYLWGTALAPGIAICVVCFLGIRGLRMLRKHIKAFRKELSNAGARKARTQPPEKADVTNPGGDAPTDKTVLGTSSLRSSGRLNTQERQRREHIAAADAIIRRLRADEPGIRKRFLCLMEADTFEEDRRSVARRIGKLERTRKLLKQTITELRQRLQQAGEELSETQRALAEAKALETELSTVPQTGTLPAGYLTDFDQLLRFPDVAAVDVDAKTNLISIFTVTLYVQFESNRYELGNFRIDLAKHDREPFRVAGVHNLATTHPSGAYYLYGGGGNYCFGTLLNTIDGLLKQGQIAAAVVNIIASLQHVNPEDGKRLAAYKCVGPDPTAKEVEQ